MAGPCGRERRGDGHFGATFHEPKVLTNFLCFFFFGFVDVLGSSFFFFNIGDFVDVFVAR